MLKDYNDKLLKLQNLIYSPIAVNDAVVDIIEIVFDDIGQVRFCPEHTHTWFEFNYVVSGYMVTSFGDEAFRVDQNEFFLVPPGLEHSHRYTPKQPHEGICLRWQLKRNPAAPEASNGSSTFDFLDSLRLWNMTCVKDEYCIGDLVMKMLDEAGNNSSTLGPQLLFAKLLTTLAEIGRPHRKQQEIKTATEYGNIIRKVEVLLNDNAFNNINVNSLAASLHMSYGHLARIYKKATGRTLLDRLCSIRLEKAAMLLEKNEYSIKEISEKTGFASQHYFSKLFKAKYGKCPKEFRQSQSES